MTFQLLIDYLNKIRNVGIHPNQTSLEQERIRMLNDMMFWSLVAEIIMLLPNLSRLDTTEFLLTALRFLFFPFIIFLQHKQKSELARLLIFILLPILFGSLIILVGKLPFFSLIFIVLIAMTVVFIGNRYKKIALICYICLIYFGVDFYADLYPPVVDLPFKANMAFISFVVLMFLAYMLIARFARVNTKTIQQLESLSDDLEVQNLALEKNKINITAQQETLEKTNKDLENFAYIASHDLKTPLRGINSFLNLIQRKLKNHPDKDIHEYLDFASNSAKKMHYLVEDILEYSRLGDKSMTISEVDLNTICQTVQRNLHELLTQSKGKIIIPTPLPVVSANETQMMILLQNLIENGLKYNKSEAPKVVVENISSPKELILNIKDNGLGISEEYHETIFGMFKRLHHDSDYQGSGVGLSICKKIVEEYQGKITVGNIPTGGTIFTITIPRK